MLRNVNHNGCEGGRVYNSSGTARHGTACPRTRTDTVPCERRLAGHTGAAVRRAPPGPAEQQGPTRTLVPGAGRTLQGHSGEWRQSVTVQPGDAGARLTMSFLRRHEGLGGAARDLPALEATWHLRGQPPPAPRALWPGGASGDRGGPAVVFHGVSRLVQPGPAAVPSGSHSAAACCAHCAARWADASRVPVLVWVGAAEPGGQAAPQTAPEHLWTGTAGSGRLCGGLHRESPLAACGSLRAAATARTARPRLCC